MNTFFAVWRDAFAPNPHGMVASSVEAGPIGVSRTGAIFVSQNRHSFTLIRSVKNEHLSRREIVTSDNESGGYARFSGVATWIRVSA